MAPLLTCVAIIALSEGALIGVLLWRMRKLRRELADQRRTEAALYAAERNAVLGRMAARVAHEVNNPLEAIKIYIEPLRHRVQDRPEVDHGLVVIDQQVDRIARLVRGLLGFVRQRTPQPTRVDVGEVIRTVSELLQGRHLELVMPVAPRHGTLDADGVQQVLINLLENGLAAIPAGGMVRLVVGDRQDGWLRITISDNGPGLGNDPEALFRPFTTTKAEGTGLGLTVARRICEAHQGWLTGANGPDGGAVFELALRMDPPDGGQGSSSQQKAVGAKDLSDHTPRMPA